ncbi:Cu+-exporting ATPase [Lutibacter oricola]|uniref:Cu+-exporting ATPase n=1 Tax=Lutibacter oricola TaxID=762486 RepID=A0A1H2S0Y8_9FLAO|nr:heavy metal-associated domain-containing protein [Lutibacter oricola]SDW25268.1 Cu+-exporting ATPase [Lutibacter oricola]
MKNLLLILVTVLTLVSCNQAKKQNNTPTSKEVKTEKLAEKLESVEVEIEGMTCEIGCAKLIQSKLYKFDGVTYANVSFENKKGEITYDANKINKEDIKSEIEKIAGGDLYSVIKTTDIDLISKESK